MRSSDEVWRATAARLAEVAIRNGGCPRRKGEWTSISERRTHAAECRGCEHWEWCQDTDLDEQTRVLLEDVYREEEQR